MSSKTVELTIKIDDNGTFKKVQVNADDLRNAVKEIKDETDRLKTINLTQLSQALDTVQQSVQQLQGVMQTFINAYAESEAASTRLKVAMQNTMNATQDEIKSVLDLTSAQQRLGVVDDDVQTAGAQELATYLSKTESLKKLIPVMNDMIAQQYDFNATSEGAVTIAQMMGKVLDGQTGALSRYGYSFDEAQEKVLKYGTEQERVAMLAQVITQYVGGQNAALRDTPTGEIKALSMEMGDIQEELGKMMAPAMNAVTKISAITIALAGIGKGITAIKAIVISLKGLSIASSLASTKTVLLGFHTKVTAMAQNMLSVATKGAAVSTRALNIAVAGLYAALSFGITLAIQGLITLFSRLCSKQDEAADGMDAMSRVNKLSKTDEVLAAQELLKGCWVSGDTEIQNDAYLMMAAVGQMGKLQEGVTAEIKNS
jgi:hypothetical protein